MINLDSLGIIENLVTLDMEFEITNIDDIKEVQAVFETINTRGFLASKNTPKQPIHSAETVGTFLLEILNNFNKIKKNILCNYMNLSSQAKQDWQNKNAVIQDNLKNDYDKYISERKILDTELKNTCYSF